MWLDAVICSVFPAFYGSRLDHIQLSGRNISVVELCILFQRRNLPDFSDSPSKLTVDANEPMLEGGTKQSSLTPLSLSTLFFSTFSKMLQL